VSRFIFTLLFLGLSCTGPRSAAEIVFSEAGLPIVRKSDVAGIPTSGPVWATAQTPDGTRWVGSNLLAAFDGVHGETIPLPNAYAFRGLASDASGRLWVGAVGAIGYVTHDLGGHWSFTSLLPELLRAGEPNPGDIWHVHALGHGAVFVTKDWILRWDGQKFDHWHRPGATRLQAFSGPADVLIYQDGVGLLRLGPTGEPVLQIAEADLPEHPITWQVASPDGSALLGLGDAAYRRTATGELVLLPELTRFLRGSVPSCAMGMGRDSVAIGTFKKGLVFASTAGTLINTAGEANGLGDDSVYSLGLGPSARLWVGLSNDLVDIEPPLRATAYDTRLGLKGTPLKVLGNGDAVCVLTDKTVFDLAAAGPTSTLPLQPRLWDAASIDGTLWAGGFGGLWRKSETSWVHEYYVSADVSRVVSIRHLPHTLVFTENYSVKALQSGPAGWVAHDLGQRVNDTPLSLVEDEAGDLWVSTRVSGIYRYAWSSSPALETPPPLRLVAHYRAGYGLPAGTTQPLLTCLGGQMYTFSGDGILGLNREGTGFEPVRTLEGFVGLSAAALPHEDRPTAYWLVQSRLLGPAAPPSLLRVSIGQTADSALEWKPISAISLNTNGPARRIDFVESVHGDALWAAHRAEVLRLSLSALAETPAPPQVTLQAAETLETRTPLNGAHPTFSAKTRHVAFYFSAVTPEGDPEVFYQTRLDGSATDWSAPSRQPLREYDGLAPGTHLFAVRALDRFGRPGLPANGVFMIATPWYRTPLALVGYAVVALVQLLGWIRWRSNRLRRQNQRLNQLVTERTRELELSNTAKSEFLENVSHEIRNPLNGLTGMLELLHEGELKPRERELARSLKACAENLARVSEEVLGYSKLEYGYVSLRNRPFAVDALFRGLVDLFQAQATRVGAVFTVKFAAGFVDGFLGDEDKIKTILGNFISNALKYAPGSPIELTADAHPIEGGMIDLFFEVTDHGPGVPEAEQELIFQKFVRGSAAKESDTPGTGLGLATCRMLAKAMNGSVGLESPPNGGATFYLRVLVAPAKLKTTNKISRAETSPSSGRRALIVEDEPYNQTVLQGVALDLGYTPTTSANAQEALAALASVEYDVVFLDWELPGAKGGDVARQVRARPDGVRPIVIATTAHDSEEIRDRCAEAGMDGFLLKPYSKERIRQMIEKVRSTRTAGVNDEVPRNRDRDSGTHTSTSELNLEAFALYQRGAPENSVDARADYIAAVEKELNLLRQNIETRQTPLVHGSAHRLRALGGLIGAQDLSRVARQLETAALPDCPSLQQELVVAWSELKQHLGQAT